MRPSIRDLQQVEGALATTWMGRPTTILDTVDSTNLWMKRAWMSGQAHHGTVVWADEQTAGRGRLGRQWVSPAGRNIYTSTLWTPPRERLSGVLSLVAGVATVNACREVAGIDVRVKWPNDVVVAGKKVAGILVEAGLDPTPWAIVGIGINVMGRADPQFLHASTLQEAAGRDMARETLWPVLMASLERAYETWMREGDSWATQAWTVHNATLGWRVRVERPGKEALIGVAEAVDQDGGLWIAADGGREKVISGEVSVRLDDGRYAPDNC